VLSPTPLLFKKDGKEKTTSSPAPFSKIEKNRFDFREGESQVFLFHQMTWTGALFTSRHPSLKSG
jgi:hypothetical protein